MKAGFSRVAVAAVALAVGGCGSTDPVVCTTEFVYGVSVEVFTADGAPAATGLAGLLEEGAHREQMEVRGNMLLGAGERAGTYDVTVTAPGHLPWVRRNVEVTADECHVIPVELTARLVADIPSE